VIDHFIATTTIMTVSGGLFGGRPRFAFIGFFLSVLMITPMTWWFLKAGKTNA
jgi:hypothetical protein